MKYFILLILAHVFLFGCSSQTPQEEIRLYYGIYTTGRPFMDWDGFLHYQYQSNGSFEFSDRVKMTTSFGRKAGEKLVEMKIESHLTEDDAYVISGTYSSKEPFTLVFLGTGENVEDDKFQRYEAGDGDIAFTGTLPLTFEEDSNGL